MIVKVKPTKKIQKKMAKKVAKKVIKKIKPVKKVKSKEWLLERLMRKTFGDKKEIDINARIIFEEAIYGRPEKKEVSV